MKRKNKGYMSILLIFAMLVSAIAPVSVSRADSAGGKSNLYEGDGFCVQFTVTEAWDTMYNASVTITNTGNVTIDDWFLKFPFAKKIKNIWNGTVEKEADGYTYIKNSGHNQDISPKESVTFGMTVEGKFEEYPDTYELLGKRAVVNEKDCTVSYEVSEDWGSGFIGTVVIKNTSKHVLKDWGIDFSFDNPIQNVWNALISSKEGKQYKIRNAGYNQNIDVGECVEFGFQVVGGDSENLMCDMSVTNISFEEDDLPDINSPEHVSQTPTPTKSETGKEETGKEESGKEETEKGETGKEETGKEESGKDETGQEETGKEESGKDETEKEETGKDKTEDGEKQEEKEILAISETGLTLEERGYVLNADFTTITGTVEQPEKVKKLTVEVYDKKDILIYHEKITPESNWSMKKVGLVYGINRLVFSASTEDGYVESKEITVIMESSAYMEALQVDCDDTDGDGLFNYLEDVFGTDKEEKDTDGDGLTDYDELYIFGYDPLEPDTDGDGNSDYEEDEDEDGISNGVELNKGYLPLDDDSDNDGLPDGEELAFGTSPIEPDTDRDDITDYDEFQLEQLHCAYDEETGQYTKTFTYEPDEEEYQEPVVPSLTFTGNAKGVLSFQMEWVSGGSYLNPSMTGYLGAAYDFTTAGKMKNAVLTFTYDEKLLGEDIVSQKSFCPTIYYFNEETENLEEVEGQVWEGNRVTATLSHFSTYILANKTDLEALWERTQKVENKLTKDPEPIKETVFVIDYNRYMESYDRDAIHREEIVLDYINNEMEENERMILIVMGVKGQLNIVEYNFGNGQGISVISKTEWLERVNDAFYQIAHYGHEDSYRQLEIRFCSAEALADNLWKMTDAEDKKDGIPKQRNIYWMTDGAFRFSSPDNYFHTDEHLELLYANSQKYDCSSHIIGLGENNAWFLRPIAKKTGGLYFQYDKNFDINAVYQETKPEKQDSNEPDKNKDGLNDELERKICDGEITTITGTTIFSPDSYNKLMDSDDYDGDGLKNGEEIEIYHYRKATYFRIKSLPYIYDSDCDGYSDYEEVRKMNTPPCKANFVIQYSDVSYLNNIGNFESGKAFNKYVDSKGIGNVAAKTLDVVFCGGKVNLTKATSKELAECLAEDAKENETAALAASIAEITNTYVSGLVDLLPEVNKLDVTYHVDEYVESVNNLQKAIKILKQGGDNEELIRTMQTNLKKHAETWKADMGKLNSESSKIKKYGTCATFAMTFVSSLASEIEDWNEHYACVKQLAGYRDILQKLSGCHAENVEEAAQKVLKQLNKEYWEDIGNSGLRVLGDELITALQYFATKRLQTATFFVGLAVIAAGIVLGDSMSVGTQNCVSVNLAIGMMIVSNGTITSKTIQKDCAGNVQVAYDTASDYMMARRLWLLEIYTVQHCEEQYHSYILTEEKTLNSKMLYFTKDSRMNASDNIIEMMRMHNDYVM